MTIVGIAMRATMRLIWNTVLKLTLESFSVCVSVEVLKVPEINAINGGILLIKSQATNLILSGIHRQNALIADRKDPYPPKVVRQDRVVILTLRLLPRTYLGPQVALLLERRAPRY